MPHGDLKKGARPAPLKYYIFLNNNDQLFYFSYVVTWFNSLRYCHPERLQRRVLGATLCRYHPFGSGRGWEGDDDDHDDDDDDDDDDGDIGGRDHGVQKLQRKNDRDRGRENEGGTKNELWLVYPHDREMKGIAA